MSIGPSVGLSVGPSVSNDQVSKWDNEHFGYFSFKFVCGGEDWGLYGGWMLLPTRPQRCCDPASLVALAVALSLALFLVIAL